MPNQGKGPYAYSSCCLREDRRSARAHELRRSRAATRRCDQAARNVHPQRRRAAVGDAVFATQLPFWHAHKIKEPVLLIHGEADNNSGTFPIQSERLYMAVTGHGGTVRYVTLPHEAHGYVARESVLHVAAEMLNWMDEHVKQAKPRPAPTSAGNGVGR
ncbi:MAG: prolyl oligopeptidase family serine peptidase [Luteitalea sp.]|nr:prolyl oligopeptidase family serine peptidase [Luteitalea sp.]